MEVTVKNVPPVRLTQNVPSSRQLAKSAGGQGESYTANY
jgi:hypothetical protein